MYFFFKVLVCEQTLRSPSFTDTVILSFIRELSFFLAGPGDRRIKMQIGPFLKILKNKGTKFSARNYFWATVFKNQPVCKKSPYIFDSVL